MVGSEAVAGAGAVVGAVAGGFQTPSRILIVFGHLWHYNAFETDHISCAVFGPSYFADRLLQLLFANMATSTLAKIVEKQNLAMKEEKKRTLNVRSPFLVGIYNMSVHSNEGSKDQSGNVNMLSTVNTKSIKEEIIYLENKIEGIDCNLS